MTSPKKLLIYNLVQEYYVSDSVTTKDKIEAQERLNPFHLKISIRIGYISVIDLELGTRRALAGLVSTLSMIDIDNSSNTIDQSHFSLEPAKIILEEIGQIETDLQARLPYLYNVNTFSHLYIMLEWLKISSRKIASVEVVDIRMTDYDDLILKEGRRTINDTEGRLGRSIDDLEINYLY